MEQLKVTDLVLALQKTITFKDKSKYYIDKELKQKYKLTSVKKNDYIKALNDLEVKSGAAAGRESVGDVTKPSNMTMNDDILYNLLLQADVNTLEQLCLTNKAAVKICKDNNFWKTKLIQDRYRLIGTNYKELYFKYNKAEKYVNDILHINRIETSRKNLRTAGDIDIVNNDYFKNLSDFYQKIPFIKLNDKYNDPVYTFYKIRFQLIDNQYKCTLMLLGESKYLSDTINFTINYPFDKLKILLIHFVYHILNNKDNEEYLECIDDNDVPFIFYKDFYLKNYSYLMDRKYFNSNIFYLRRGIWEGLNL